MIRYTISALLCGALVAFSFQLQAAPNQLHPTTKDAALVLSVDPGVEAMLNGKTDALVPKMEISLKSTVKSDATGRSQIIFPDDATITISPNTEVALIEFIDEPGGENIVLNLAVGTMRVITGEASRRNPAAFTVNTPQATIGIRGTMVIIEVSGDMTRIYLQETSGKGVTVRSRGTGRVLELFAPGDLITVGPRIFETSKATRQEARRLRSAFARLANQATDRQTALARRRIPPRLVAQGDLPFTTGLEVAQMDEATRGRENAWAVPNRPGGGNAGMPVNPVSPPPNPSGPDQPGTPPATPETPVTPPDVPVTPPVTPVVPPASGPGNTPLLPDTPVAPEAFKVTMPELAGNFSGTGTFNYYYVQTPETAFGASRTGNVSFTVPQTYTSMNNDVYQINLTNVKTPGYQNGNFIAEPAQGSNLTVNVNRQTGAISQVPGQISTTPQEIRALMLKGAFDNNQGGKLDTVHFTAGTGPNGQPLRGRNQGAIEINKR